MAPRSEDSEIEHAITKIIALGQGGRRERETTVANPDHPNPLLDAVDHHSEASCSTELDQKGESFGELAGHPRLESLSPSPSERSVISFS